LSRLRSSIYFLSDDEDAGAGAAAGAAAGVLLEAELSVLDFVSLPLDLESLPEDLESPLAVLPVELSLEEFDFGLALP
jgi:hypothetical protein